MPRVKSRRSRNVCVYCGPSKRIPPGYDVKGDSYSCLRKGWGAGSHTERRSWQRRMGYKVDPEYISPCGQNRVYKKSKNRGAHARKPRKSRSKNRSKSPSVKRSKSKSISFLLLRLS